MNDGGGGNVKLLRGGDFACNGEIGREEGCEDIGGEGGFDGPAPGALDGAFDQASSSGVPSEGRVG